MSTTRILETLQIAQGAGPSTDGQTFQEIIHDLTLPHQSDDGVSTNKYDLLCPRGCRSVILKRGVGQLVERSGIEVGPNSHRMMPGPNPCDPPRSIPPIIHLIPPSLPFRRHLRRCHGGSSPRPRWRSKTSGSLDPWRVRVTHPVRGTPRLAWCDGIHVSSSRLTDQASHLRRLRGWASRLV